jgi:hypothetical protein
LMVMQLDPESFAELRMIYLKKEYHR